MKNNSMHEHNHGSSDILHLLEYARVEIQYIIVRLQKDQRCNFRRFISKRNFGFSKHF